MPNTKTKEQEHTSSRSSFTSAKHDEEFHKNFIDFSGAGRDDEDIFVPDAFLDLDRCLAVTELAEDGLAFGYAETVAY